MLHCPAKNEVRQYNVRTHSRTEVDEHAHRPTSAKANVAETKNTENHQTSILSKGDMQCRTFTVTYVSTSHRVHECSL